MFGGMNKTPDTTLADDDQILQSALFYLLLPSHRYVTHGNIRGTQIVRGASTGAR